MGLFENLSRDAPGTQRITQQGQAFATTSKLLYGWVYDAARTAALALPDGVDGAAFSKNGAYSYVLWAKAVTDNSEAASATYSFPAALSLAAVDRYEWNYATTNVKTTQASQNIALTATPLFFTAASGSVVTGAQSAAAGTPRSQVRAYPNPLSRHEGRAVIEFSAAQSGAVAVSLFNLQGQLVRQLFNGTVEAGIVRTLPLEAAGLSEGLYLVRLVTTKEVINQKVVVGGQ